MSKVLDYIMGNYEITNFPQYGSCFLAQDGYFVFPDKKGEKSSLTFHDDLLDDLYENFSSQEVNSFIDSWFILNSRSMECKIGFPKNSPTKEQYELLLEWLDYIVDNGVVDVQLISQSSNNYLQVNLKKTTSDEIIKAIKRFYVSGILFEDMSDNSWLQPVPNDYKIIEIQPFKNKIKNVKNTFEDNEIEIYIKTNPPEVNYGGGLYKIRFASKSSNRSKRGYLRILYGRVDNLKICILMSVLEKKEKENFTDSEIKSFKIMLKAFRK